MPSFEVYVEIDDAIADEMSGELFALGAEAIEVRDREGLKLPNVVLPPEGKTWLICGFTESSREALEAALATELADTPYKYVITKVLLRDDTDWAHKWKEFYRPLRVGEKLWVSPSWEKPIEVPGAVVIRLDPEMAFGTGQHATTRLCLGLLERYCLSHDLEKARMFDVGTGSGILAIGAGLLGARNIIGIDTDEVSVDTAKQNADRNGVGDRMRFAVGGMPQFVEHARQEAPNGFDLILANILADPLIEMAPHLCALLAPGGWLVLSGLLTEQAERVQAAYTTEGKRVDDHLREDEWSALLIR